jgi:murein DD-endopeptidase MepM/ murein hydrolase activator NlpD
MPSFLAYPDAIARPPVTPIHIPADGAYGFVRTSTSEGACGIHGYPCTHRGVDLVAPKGTLVAAPHDGWVIVSQATNDPPFAGYGPAVVLLAHDDGTNKPLAERLIDVDSLGKANYVSLRYSLLAHLDPSSLRYSLPWKQAVGLLDTDDAQRWKHMPNEDGIARVSDWPAWAQYVKAGEHLGRIGDAGHVHWEIRTAPIPPRGPSTVQTAQPDLADVVDPIGWLHFYDPSVPWDTAMASPMAKGSGIGLVEIALGLIVANELLG